MTDRAPWIWRKAEGGFTSPSDDVAGHRLFHACDVNDNLACALGAGLAGTCEEPNEGSELCSDCQAFVIDHPEGRDQRVYT